MARFKFNTVATLGVDVLTLSTDWQVSIDQLYNVKLVDIVQDSNNLYSLNTPLINPNGTVYTGDDIIYARARIYLDGSYLDWVNLPTCTNEQINNLTEAELNALVISVT